MKYVWKEPKKGKAEGFLVFDSGKTVFLKPDEYLDLREWMNRKETRNELLKYDMINSLRVAFV